MEEILFLLPKRRRRVRLEKVKKTSKRQFWVRSVLKRRQELGEYVAWYKNCGMMTKTFFMSLCRLVILTRVFADSIGKQLLLLQGYRHL